MILMGSTIITDVPMFITHRCKSLMLKSLKVCWEDPDHKRVIQFGAHTYMAVRLAVKNNCIKTYDWTLAINWVQITPADIPVTWEREPPISSWYCTLFACCFLHPDHRGIHVVFIRSTISSTFVGRDTLSIKAMPHASRTSQGLPWSIKVMTSQGKRGQAWRTWPPHLSGPRCISALWRKLSDSQLSPEPGEAHCHGGSSRDPWSSPWWHLVMRKTHLFPSFRRSRSNSSVSESCEGYCICFCLICWRLSQESSGSSG